MSHYGSFATICKSVTMETLITGHLTWSPALAAGLQTGSSGGSGYKLPPQSLPCAAPPGPEAQQRAAGHLSQRQGESQALREGLTSFCCIYTSVCTLYGRPTSLLVLV